ncbi:cytoplasmic dynein 1 light intermediate chain 1 isoform X2 [Eurytemora carolleeae]|uniref:cytoplasmic dynein 1 light intermediate chain 1 isoform X2 n=1 Tax=Eurytemora carolleeae TaxID=1294199 RepID=UPI000C779E47|nr:cytoplasmic dynein 1 light intermediate chain 1 isoform X2 [Eurytemora carolleeae]|eukprot:XP_023345071.1 cytoplasmic dynein 1 light intermediate chain 1-like isoform X2 [Eurytemora affinis]
MAGHKSSQGRREMSRKESEVDTGQDVENLWSTLLAEVQTSRSAQLPTTKSLLLLGDKESGKTTLIAKLQGNEDPKKGSGLEYGYIDVRDEYREDHTRLSHWILDGDTSHTNLLTFALTEENYADTTVLLCVSMTTPWNIMDQLQNWASLLQDHIDKLPLSGEEVKKYQTETWQRWQEYTEPGDEQEVASPTKRGRGLGEVEGEPDLEPLPEGTLARNLGLELLVVVTKTDYMMELEKDFDYKDEHFDFIQQAIRKFCLQYGASLFYTSVKEDKNCDLLYKYLVHRIFNFPFKTPALVVEKDAVFIPAGWDNDKKIAILYENMHSVRPDQYYTDVIARPMSVVGRKQQSSKELEVVAEEEQNFLGRQQHLLQQGVPPGGGGSGGVIPAGVQKTPDRKVVGSPGVQGSPKKWRPAVSSIYVRSSFFFPKHSLL